MIKTASKFLLGGALLYFLARRGMVSLASTRDALADWPHSLAGFGAIVVASLLTMWRWRILLAAQGIAIGTWRALELTLIGSFFNVALPGAVSGDFVKAFVFGKLDGEGRARVLSSVLFDRVVGVSALVLVAAAAVFLAGLNPGAPPFPEGLRIFVVIAVAGVAAFYAYLFLMPAHRDPLAGMLTAIGARWPKLQTLARIYDGIVRYRGHSRTVLITLLMSACVHLLLGWAGYCYASALGEPGLPVLAFCATIPLALLVNVFRVSPAGVGTGHAAFQFMLGLVGFHHGADIFTLFALGDMVFATIGGLIYLRFKSEIAVAT